MKHIVQQSTIGAAIQRRAALIVERASVAFGLQIIKIRLSAKQYVVEVAPSSTVKSRRRLH